ncbi:hypothetical protein CYY_001424 [Polysphondylium violaceum]|uniref:DOMON domain-containing protein n=1 Tax=Polysphondylium violaceum TaxID=133409 RepID=A0A8J4Q1X4_9MYCE|nr:hypothetical protein CYY_001424 [Polysphondylium violaceum]
MMLKIYIFILSIFYLIHYSQSVLSPGVILDPINNFTLKWDIINNDTIVFQVEVNVKTWIGIGWHPSNRESDGPMINSDYAVGMFDNVTGLLKVVDMVSGAKAPGKPVPDSSVNATNDFMTFSGYQQDNYTFMVFARKLITNDTVGDRDIYLDSPLDLIWAYGTSNNFGYHKTNAGRVKVSLWNTNPLANQKETQALVMVVSSDSKNYKTWHGALMMISFGVLMPLAIFVARYLKEYSWWFPLHIFLQTGAFICIIVSFALIIVQKTRLDLSIAHNIIGFIVILNLFIAMALGVCSHFMWNRDRKKTPIFPDIVHHYHGRFVFLLSVAAMITGILKYSPSPLSNPFVVCYSMIIGLYLAVFLFIEVYKKFISSTPK